MKRRHHWRRPRLRRPCCSRCSALIVAEAGARLAAQPDWEATSTTIAPAALRNDAGKVSGWRAQFRDGDNRKRQLGVLPTRAAAQRAAEAHVADLNAGRAPVEAGTLGEWMELWPTRVGCDPRTVQTHRHRIEAYVYPHLPYGRNQQLGQVSRKHLHDIQAALLAQGLSKSTIDGAIASLSAVLGCALPKRKRVERRWIPPHEAGRLLDAVDPRHWALVLTPFLAGVRPEELLALRRMDIDAEHIRRHSITTRGTGYLGHRVLRLRRGAGFFCLQIRNTRRDAAS